MAADAKMESFLEGENFAELTFATLAELCGDRHSSATDEDEKNGLAKYTLKCLMPRFLMLDSNNRPAQGQNIPQHFQHLRELSLAFLLNLIEKNSEKMQSSLYILCQHLCRRAPDKAEYRRQISAQFPKLIPVLNENFRSRFLVWLVSFSQSALVSDRGFSLDIISMLLAMQNQQNLALRSNQNHVDVKRELLKIVISRLFFLAFILKYKYF